MKVGFAKFEMNNGPALLFELFGTRENGERAFPI
jgi:hypothetical protein